MAQAFTPTANILARASLVIGVLVLGAVFTLGMVFYRSPAVTQVGVNKEQPIPFSHARHVAGNAIDCRYCHTSVEHSNFAGIPPTETCMTCHSQILSDAPLLKPVQESWKEGQGLVWTRVNDLPDFVYFDHSVHLASGVGCTTCHGEIDEMPLTHKANTFHMGWCLQCHREPERYVRPLDKVYDTDWTGNELTLEEGQALVKEYGIVKEQLTNCSVCHR
ncbi:MAG: cytochrome c3 family protein [Candidatus Hydrogenedentes bacterium]|nr:cytochrome c3 family protein [Candidatus Hydrogenedentota bacterium]